MQIAEVVALPPACCFVCKKGNQEEKPFIDTLRHDVNGHIANRLYLCFECVEEAAGLHGFMNPSEAQKVKDAAEAAVAERDAAVARAEAFAKIVAGVEELQATAPAKAKKSASIKKVVDDLEIVTPPVKGDPIIPVDPQN